MVVYEHNVRINEKDDGVRRKELYRSVPIPRSTGEGMAMVSHFPTGLIKRSL